MWEQKEPQLVKLCIALCCRPVSQLLPSCCATRCVASLSAPERRSCSQSSSATLLPFWPEVAVFSLTSCFFCIWIVPLSLCSLPTQICCIFSFSERPLFFLGGFFFQSKFCLWREEGKSSFSLAFSNLLNRQTWYIFIYIYRCIYLFKLAAMTNTPLF